MSFLTNPEGVAKELFPHIVSSIMSHAVQATEMKLSKNRAPFEILITKDPHLFRCTGEMATVAVQYLNRKAYIEVDGTQNIEDQRKAVVHELGHVLLCGELIGSGQGTGDKADEEHEQACQDFERELCSRLQYLYAKTNYQEVSKFPSLDAIVDSKETAFHLEYVQATEA